MVVVERQRLLAMARILRVIQVERHAFWRAGKAGKELLNEGGADAINVFAAGGVLKARDRCAQGQRRNGKRPAPSLNIGSWRKALESLPSS